MSKFLNSLNLLPLLSTMASMPRVPNIVRNAVYNRAAGRNFGIATRQRNRRNASTRIRRRNRKNKGANGIEINKAQGGFKTITIPYRTLPIGINTYARLLAVKIGDSYQYQIAPEYNNFAGTDSLNLINMLNFSSEFTERLQASSQYKLLSVLININNNRIPQARDMMTKLLLYVNTERVQVQQPKIQSNVMRLNMNVVGTSNFNFRLNRTNMKQEDLDWQDSMYLFPSPITLHLESEDINLMPEENETTVILGTIKVTFSLLTRVQDYMKVQQPVKKVTVDEEIRTIKNTLAKLSKE
jgi:hypothetical protein